MDEEKEYNEVEETVEEPAEKETGSPLAEAHQAVTDAETAITDGSKTKDEAIDELIATLEGMKEGVEEDVEMMGGLGGGSSFPLPEPEM